MWRMLPFQWLVYYFLFGLVLVFLLMWRVQGKPHYLKKGGKGLLKLFGTLWTTVTVFTILTVLAGKFMWYPLASTRWFSEIVFADVSGDWQGTLQTAVAGQAPGTREAPDIVEVHIEQDFFELEITFTSDSRRTDSRTIAIWPERDAVTRRQRLWYVYETRSPGPATGEPPVYQGAGFIDVRKSHGRALLEGLFWTNRDWQRNAHGAGVIKLRPAGTVAAPPAIPVAPM